VSTVGQIHNPGLTVPTSVTQVVLGALLYLLGAAVVAVSLRVTRWAAGVNPTT
jgi:hypothetical protein